MEEDESFGLPPQIPMSLNGLSLGKGLTKEEALCRRKWHSLMGFGNNELSLSALLPMNLRRPQTHGHRADD